MPLIRAKKERGKEHIRKPCHGDQTHVDIFDGEMETRSPCMSPFLYTLVNEYTFYCLVPRYHFECCCRNFFC